MKAFLTVLQREILERRMILAVAAITGLIPLALPLLPGARGQAPSDLRGGAALILHALLSLFLALILGGSVLTRDLAERRLGFYFSRPLTGLSIWGGKLAAATLLTAAAGLLVLLPSFLLGDPLDPSGHWGHLPSLNLALRGLLGVWAAQLFLLLLAAHALSSMLRSRTPWILADLAGLVVTAGLFWVSWNRLLYSGAVELLSWVFLAASGGLVLALLGSSAVQICRGRSDLHAGHRWLSSTLWTSLLIGGAALFGFSSWVLNAKPTDLTRIEYFRAAPTGDWIYVQGPTAYRGGYNPGFLIDSTSGRFLRTGAAAIWSLPVFSADGRWAAWLEYRGNSKADLVVRELAEGGSEERRRFEPSGTVDLALSPDGSRLAFYSSGRLVVEETATGRLVTARAVGFYGVDQFLYFVDDDHVRLYQVRWKEGLPAKVGHQISIHEIDIPASEMIIVGHAPAGIPLMNIHLSADRSRALGRGSQAEGAGEAFYLFDARSGEVLRTLPIPRPDLHAPVASSTWNGGRFLRDGRLVLTRSGGGGCTLQVLAPDGARELRRFEWPGMRQIRVGGQPSRDQLVVAVAPNSVPFSRQYQTYVVDLAGGGRRLLGSGLQPIGSPSHGHGSSAGTEMFLRDGQNLVRLDLTTGKVRRTVLAID